MWSEIKSRENNRFKTLKILATKKGRDKMKMFLAEGKKFINLNPKYVFSSDNIFEDHKDHFKLSKNLFNEISTLQNSEGYLSVFDIKPLNLSDISGNIVILDEIQNPDNLGAIIRNMDAFGFKNLLLTKGCCDPYNMKSVRASMGSILNIKILYVKDEEIRSLKERYKFYAAALGGRDVQSLHYEHIYNKDFALILGNESRGISTKLLDISEKITIEISNTLDSLNVAVASGILIYELDKLLKTRS